MRERKLTADCKYIVVAARPQKKAASVNLLFVKTIVKNEILSLFCDACGRMWANQECGRGKSGVCARGILAREESFPISVSAVETDGIMNNNWALIERGARTHLP